MSSINERLEYHWIYRDGQVFEGTLSMEDCVELDLDNRKTISNDEVLNKYANIVQCVDGSEFSLLGWN